MGVGVGSGGCKGCGGENAAYTCPPQTCHHETPGPGTLGQLALTVRSVFRAFDGQKHALACLENPPSRAKLMPSVGSGSSGGTSSQGSVTSQVLSA